MPATHPRPIRLVAVAVTALSLLLGLIVPATGAVGEHLLVVDTGHADASDGNRGTLDAPFATIQAALDAATQLNAAGEGVRVRVLAGTYREALHLRGGSARTDAPLVIEGDGAAQVVVDGADVWTEWEPSSQVAGAWTTYWPHEWGLAAVPSGWGDVLERRGEVLRRREVVWVDGALMRQVLHPEDLAPGTFLVDESSKSLTVLPAQGVSVDEANVEVAVRGHGLQVEGWRNLTLRGMTFRRAATSLQQAGVRFADTADVLVEDVRSEQHNWGGLAVQNSQGVMLRRVALTGNGVLGLSVWRGEGLEVIDVDNSYNNTWRGPWAGYYGWEAGSKVFRARDITFDGWRAVGNESYGLWLDTDVSDAVIRDSFIADNRRSGLFLEAMQGPVTVENTTICNNRGAGILDGKADEVTLEGNRIFGNSGAQLQFSGELGGRAFTTYDSGDRLLVRSTGWTMRNNVLEGGEGARVIGNHLNAEDWALVRDSLHAEGNRYHHASDARPFTISGAIVGFNGWRAEVGTDADSAFSTVKTGLNCETDLPPLPAPSDPEGEDTISVPAPSDPEDDGGDPGSTTDPDPKEEGTTSGPAPADPELDCGAKGRAFRDVSSSSPHSAPIRCLVGLGVIRGTSLELYSPGRQVSRAQIASMVDRALRVSGRELPAGSASFLDVADDNVHRAAIERLSAAGVLRGSTDDRFQPDRPMTRGQLARLLTRTHALLTTGVLPSGGPEVLDEVIALAIQADLARGYPDGDFRADRPVRRDQAASFVHNLLKSTA